MALKHARSGETVNLLSPGESPAPISQALVSTPEIELMRLVLKAGKDVPVHAVAGPITLYCHEGTVDVQVESAWQRMNAQDLMYVEGGADHALRAVTDTLVLVTIFRVPASH